MRKRKWLMLVAVVVATTVMAVVGASVYMLDYSLAPDPNRRDVDSCYQQLLAEYPECGEWMDRGVDGQPARHQCPARHVRGDGNGRAAPRAVYRQRRGEDGRGAAWLARLCYQVPVAGTHL